MMNKEIQPALGIMTDDNSKYIFEHGDRKQISVNRKLSNGNTYREIVVVTRIRAVREINIPEKKIKIPKRTLGGYIECYQNLSQAGNCWIDNSSIVTGNVKICGSSQVSKSVLTGKGRLSNSSFTSVMMLDPDILLQDNSHYYTEDEKVMACIDGRTILISDRKK